MCRYKRDLQGLFAKYKAKPMQAMLGPVANISIFVPFFFGIRKMGEYVPGEETPLSPPHCVPHTVHFGAMDTCVA